ncbi:MAG: V-type ATPase subunit [Treponema sp.]|nr:V-type ATPase subunit [Treponema sp.]
MDKSAARAYVYAKASGSLGKSFIGERANSLFQAKSLSELWNLLFNSQSPMIPEVLLAEEIENKAFSEFIKKYSGFLNQFDKPDDYLLSQFIIYEVENLKTLGDTLCSGKKEKPKFYELGSFSKLNYDAWPELSHITKGTEYEWFNVVPGIHEQALTEYKLDIQAVKHIWNSVSKLKTEAGKIVRKIIFYEFDIQNIVWALRLKLNYGYSDEEVIQRLMFVTEKPSLKDPLCANAIKVLSKNPEQYSDWENWVYSGYINPKESNDLWKIEPSWIEKKARSVQNRKALMLFHNYPLTSESLFGWFKVKQYELGLIRMAVESIRLNETVALEV